MDEMDGRRKKEKTLTTITDFDRPLWEFLRRKQKRRRVRGGRKVQRVRIPDRVSIHARPKIVDKRKQFGHWEEIVLLGKIMPQDCTLNTREYQDSPDLSISNV